MRISDWSSDVCSSDLSAGAAGFSRALRAIAALLAALAVAAAAYASHGLSGDAQMRLSLAAAFAFGHGVALLVLAGFAVKLRFRVVRSGEHTSELQSLMRISYAVFCLK